MPTNTLSVGDAARHVGRSKATIYRRIKTGKLPAVADGQSFLVEKADLEREFAPRPVVPAAPMSGIDPEIREWAEGIAADAPPLNPRTARAVVGALLEAQRG